MPRVPRLLNAGESTVYHVMSRTALDGFPLGDIEKDFLLKLLKSLSKLYFVDVLGFAIMGNHFHFLVRMIPDNHFSDEEILQRIKTFYGKKRMVTESQIPEFRTKLSSLSELMKDLKQTFTRHYNKEKKRFGFFWGQRFKSLIVEEGETLINCLAYIDLNPVRAGLVERPEDYRWNTLGYLMQTNNKEGFLSLNFGLHSEENMTIEGRIKWYRQFVYEIGTLPSEKGKSIDQAVLQTEQNKGFQITRTDRFKYRTRYFTDSGVIGSRAFVARQYDIFEDYFNSRRPKKPVPIEGLDGCFSLKQLALKGQGS